jgi:hypothetical protein
MVPSLISMMAPTVRRKGLPKIIGHAALHSTSIRVLDTGVCRSTCSWAPSLAHLQPRGEPTIQATGEDPHEEASHEENGDQKLLRTRRPPHELPLVRGGTTSTSDRHVCVQSKKIEGRRPRTAHATPDREETNFRRVCIKQHSGCWPPP